jgi:hypothetical protein
MSSPTSFRTGASLALVLLLSVSLMACSSGAPATESPATVPTAPSGSEPGDGGGAAQNPGNPDRPIDGGDGGPVEPPGAGDGALPVQPEPGIVEPRPHPWDHISVAADGRTITIYYTGGIQDCYGLAGVDAARRDDGTLQVTVFEGRRGNLGRDVACIDIGVFKSVTIELEQPLIAPAS